MKKYYVFTFLLSVLLLSGCTQTASDDLSASVFNNASFDEKTREVVQDEIAKADLSEQVEKGIQKFIDAQEAEAKKVQEDAGKPQYRENISVDDDPFIGDANAPVTIVEFSDFECPFCSRHLSTVFPEIKEKYIDTGKVKYVFRDLPLGFHQSAIPAAIAANCALEQSDNETYFKFHDRLFADQQNLNENAFKRYANELGLNADKFASCLKKADATEIQADMKDGSDYGVSGTPGFFINGWQIKGAYPFSAFEELIEKELAGN